MTIINSKELPYIGFCQEAFYFGISMTKSITLKLFHSDYCQETPYFLLSMTTRIKEPPLAFLPRRDRARSAHPLAPDSDSKTERRDCLIQQSLLSIQVPISGSFYCIVLLYTFHSLPVLSAPYLKPSYRINAGLLPDLMHR